MLQFRSKLAIASGVVLCALAGGAAGAQPGEPDVHDLALSDGNTMAVYVYAESEDQPTIVLVHGASDTHSVYDFSEGFSVARRLAQRGFGVVAIDRVGYGASSRPNGDTLHFSTQAQHLHELVTALRAGDFGYVPPAVVTLGASLGADLAIVEAGTYHDVDGVIVSFHTDQLQPELFEVDFGQFLAQGDYFDFGVDFRTRFFYAEPWALDWVIERDNATRSLVPRGEILSALMGGSAPYRDDIDVPVLLIQAANDELFVPQDDSALFSAAPEVSFELLRNAGHKGYSHPTSQGRAVAVIADWLRGL